MTKNINKIANFFLDKKLLANDISIEKLFEINKKFKLYDKIACFPDLNFKIKNYVPSGTAIKIKNEFAPILLGNSNDAISIIKISLNKKIKNSDIDYIFKSLKKKIAIFRREKYLIDNNCAQDILINGIKNKITEWGFNKKDLKKFNQNGCACTFKKFSALKKKFPKKRPKKLASHILTSEILKSTRKSIGVLDGTSHFIELYKYKASYNKKYINDLNIKSNDYFVVIHAGSADPGLIIHRYLMNKKNRSFSIKTSLGKNLFYLHNSTTNFGFANRLYIMKTIKETFQKRFNDKAQFEILNDNDHDFLDFDKKSKIFTHRKGVVKISPSKKGIWKKTGEPYFLPSYVGGDGYILSNFKGNKKSFFCSSHGLGRMYNKDETLKIFRKESFKKSLTNKIKLFRYGKDKIRSQNPKAFKSINLVLKSFKKYNLAYPICSLKPLASLKA